MTTKINQKLADRAKSHALKEIERIRAAPKDSKIAAANPHLVPEEGTLCAGLLELRGLYWFSMEVLALVFTSGDTYHFEGEGTGWIASVASCEVGGYFVVPPGSLSGEAKFELGIGALAEGYVSAGFYDNKGRFLGSVVGFASGLGAGGVSGHGTFHRL